MFLSLDFEFVEKFGSLDISYAVVCHIPMSQNYTISSHICLELRTETATTETTTISSSTAAVVAEAAAAAVAAAAAAAAVAVVVIVAS